MAGPFVKARLPIFKRAQVIGCAPAQVAVDLKQLAVQAQCNRIVNARVDVKLAVDTAVTRNQTRHSALKVVRSFEGKGAQHDGVLCRVGQGGFYRYGLDAPALRVDPAKHLRVTRRIWVAAHPPHNDIDLGSVHQCIPLCGVVQRTVIASPKGNGARRCAGRGLQRFQANQCGAGLPFGDAFNILDGAAGIKPQQFGGYGLVPRHVGTQNKNMTVGRGQIVGRLGHHGQARDRNQRLGQRKTFIGKALAQPRHGNHHSTPRWGHLGRHHQLPKSF